MKTFKEFAEACWNGYTQVGLKKKGGKMVPNCVPVDELSMNSQQKVTQMNIYWKDLDRMASDERKKKNMKSRFGIKNIKLDKKGNILSFESKELEK
jgi:hypothetical protein